MIAHTHAAAVRHLPESDQVQIFVTDPHPTALDTFIKSYPLARPFPDAETMLKEPVEETDIVIIATPPFSHYELTCAALASGRHVLCEKPLALNLAQAQAMLDTARQYNRLLGCCSTRFLHLPGAEEARRLLQAQALGAIYHVNFCNIVQRNRPAIEFQQGSTWFLSLAMSGGGTLMDRAPYEFSILNDLFRPKRVEVLDAWTVNPITARPLREGEDSSIEQHAGATMRYYLDDGTSFRLNYERASCSHSEPQSVVEITGLEGSVKWEAPLDTYTNTLTHIYDVNDQSEKRTITFSQENEQLSWMDKPLYYFYRRVHGQPSPAVVNEQAVFNFACIRAIYDCAASGEIQTVLRAD